MPIGNRDNATNTIQRDVHSYREGLTHSSRNENNSMEDNSDGEYL